jgi:hypothetical protein
VLRLLEGIRNSNYNHTNIYCQLTPLAKYTPSISNNFMCPKLNVPGLTTRMSISGGNRVRDCHNQSPLKRPRAKEPQIKALFHFVHGFYFVYVRYWRVHFYGHQPLHKLLIVIVFRCVTVKITVKLRNMH